jgi:hypoxanthine phosphoribosyltransferase
MNFISCYQMNEWTLKLIEMIPNKFDLIVGLPRSGLPLASIVAAKFGRPLITPGCDQVWYSRFSHKAEIIKSILICDDTISTGGVMDEAVKKVKQRFPEAEVKIAVVVAQSSASNKVDYLFKEMEHPRMFEWNIAHGKWGNLACDIDGVIARDLPAGLIEHLQPNAYKEHITNTPAIFVPQYTIDVIVSCRLEKWRKITEEWLAKHNIRYGQLLLWNIDDPLARADGHADYKINRIKDTGATYVFESNFDQALRINIALRLPVLCFDRMTMIG